MTRAAIFFFLHKKCHSSIKYVIYKILETRKQPLNKEEISTETKLDPLSLTRNTRDLSEKRQNTTLNNNQSKLNTK